jgi:hypothetical protein
LGTALSSNEPKSPPPLGPRPSSRILNLG